MCYADRYIEALQTKQEEETRRPTQAITWLKRFKLNKRKKKSGDLPKIQRCRSNHHSRRPSLISIGIPSSKNYFSPLPAYCYHHHHRHKTSIKFDYYHYFMQLSCDLYYHNSIMHHPSPFDSTRLPRRANRLLNQSIPNHHLHPPGLFLPILSTGVSDRKSVV